MLGWVSNTSVAEEFVNEFVMPIVILLIIVLIAMIVTIIRSIYKYFFGNLEKKIKYKELSNEELKQFGITDKEKFKDELVYKFLKLKSAISKLDENSVKEVVDDRRAYSYLRDIENCQKYQYDHVFEEPEVSFSSISAVKDQGHLKTLVLAIIVKRKEYIIDSHKDVLKGNKYKKKSNFYLVTFNKNINLKCPKCGVVYKSHKVSSCIDCNVEMVTLEDDWKIYTVEGEKFNFVNL